MLVVTQPGPYTSSTLPNGRIAHWRLDEVSGVALDSGPNALHLTDNNTVTSAAGQVGGARQFTAAQTEYFTRADEALLRGGDHDWAWSMGLFLDSIVGARVALTKRAAAQYEYQLYVSIGRIRLYVNGTSLVANVFGNVPLSTWIHVYVQYDLVANQLGMRVNGVLETPVALASGGAATAGALYVGADQGASQWDGRIDNIQFWNARILTPAEVAEDYANWIAGRAL